jgi:hypothetical protein
VVKMIRLLTLVAIAISMSAAHAPAQELDGVMRNFASAWTRKDEKAVAALIAREGASIESDAGRFGPLGARQAAAVLRALFDERSTVDVRVRQSQTVGGSPKKAYAELVWMTLAPATTEPVRVVVFVEFVLEQEKAWRITKIRLLP